MIAAFLCGLMFGWLGYRKWLTAHNRRVLKATLPPSDDEFDMEAWGALSDEALAKFERLASAPSCGKGPSPDPYDAASAAYYT